MKLSRAVLMDVGTVREVLVSYSHVQVVATEDGNADVKSHLIDFHRLTDRVNV